VSPESYGNGSAKLAHCSRNVIFKLCGSEGNLLSATEMLKSDDLSPRQLSLQSTICMSCHCRKQNERMFLFLVPYVYKFILLIFASRFLWAGC